LENQKINQSNKIKKIWTIGNLEKSLRIILKNRKMQKIGILERNLEVILKNKKIRSGILDKTQKMKIRQKNQKILKIGDLKVILNLTKNRIQIKLMIFQNPLILTRIKIRLRKM